MLSHKKLYQKFGAVFWYLVHTDFSLIFMEIIQKYTLKNTDIYSI